MYSTTSKWTKQFIAGLLVFAITFTSCDWPVSVHAADTETVSEQKNEKVVSEETAKQESIGELESLRDESSKQFRMQDGSISLVQYETDVHYQDENGTWKEIDNSLEEADASDAEDAAGYSSKEGRVKFKFAKNANANFQVRVMQGKYHVFFAAQNSQKEAKGAKVQDGKASLAGQTDSFAKQAEVEKIRSSVIYENLFQGTDVEYITSGSSLKENIIVKEKQESYEYVFEIKTNHVEIRQEADGSITLRTEDSGEILYRIPKMYMWDAEGKESDAIEVTLVTQNKKSTLTIRPDAEWINAPERVFPVTIDPTLEATSTSTGSETRIVRNQYVAKDNPTMSSAGYGRGFLGCDGSSDGVYRLFVQFKTLPTIPKNSVIGGAKFYYAHVAYDHVGMPELTVAAKEVTTNWTWGTKVNWNTQPSFSSTVLDYQVLSASTTGTYVGWDITKLIKNHYENKDNTTNAASSFVLTGTDESNYAYNHIAKADVIQENSAGYFSNAQPVLVISYRNSCGVEPYYTYQELGLGKAGTAYVGDYSKEVTLIRPLFQTSSVTLPFGVNLVYNSAYEDTYFGSASGLNTKNYGSMKLGYGWKLNVQETVIEKTISGKKHLIYNDSDGTDHYFPLASGSTYKDEDGLKLTIVKQASPLKYTMTDEKGNQKIFQNGFLSSVIDANGNAIHLLYNGAAYSASGAWYANTGSTNKLTKIVQINNGVTTPKVIAEFDYENTTFVHVIKDHAGRSYRLHYTSVTDTAGNFAGYNLTKISDPDGSFVRYDYHLVKDVKVNKLKATYDSEIKLGMYFRYFVTKHASRIKSFSEICWTSESAFTEGRRADLTGTDPYQTSCRDWGLDCQMNTKDDIWTHLTFDHAGRTIHQTSMDSEQKVYYGASATVYQKGTGTASANRVLSDVSVGTGGINLLRNGSAEQQSSQKPVGWTEVKSIASDTQSQMTMFYDGSGGKRSGQKSFGVTINSGAQADTSGNLKASFKTTVSLESGVAYTFSGYFKNTGTTNFNNKSKAYLQVLNASGTQVAVSSVIQTAATEEIENGWSRLIVNFTPDAAGTYTLAGCVEWIYGTSCFDDFQLERGDAASGYNYLSNGNLDWTDGFTYTAGASRDSNSKLHGTYSIKITGSPGVKRTASTTVPVYTSSDNTFVLSGWAKGQSVAGISKENSSGRAFGLEAVLKYSDGSTETHYTSFDEGTNQKQFTSYNIVPKKSGLIVQTITVRCVYGKNANTVYFDGLSLKKEPVACYKYDSSGNVTAVTSAENAPVNFQYSAGNLIQSESESTGVYNYTYDNKHNLTKVSNDGVDLVLTYDAMGHVKTTKLQNAANSADRTISTAATYSTDGDYLISQTDALGNETTYTTNAAGLTSSVTDPKGDTLSYQYHTNNDRLTSVSREDGTEVEYVYGDGVLSEILRTSILPDEVTEVSQSYHFSYDIYDNVTEIRVGNRTLATYEYGPKNGPLVKMTYGNGDVVEYEHDALGRIVLEKRNGVAKLRYIYQCEGAIGRQEELGADGSVIRAVCYEYDSLGRVIRSWEEALEGGSMVRQKATEHLYDTSNRLTEQTYQLKDGTKYSETYQYNADDGTLNKMKTTSGEEIQYNYDSLKRLWGSWDGRKNISYVYENVGSAGTSNQVAQMQIRGVGSGIFFKYEYDTLGNITKVIQNGTTLAEYIYDEQSQLIEEKYSTCAEYWYYEYDTAGNIRNKRKDKSAWSWNTTFDYTDSQWGDLLTSVNGNQLTYDEIGNPLHYWNVSGQLWRFTWQNGRELETATDGYKRIIYSYDVSGIRIEKMVDGVRHYYTYIGDQLVEETYGNHCIHFAYDEQGRPYSMTYDGTKYYYVLNLQGDVVAITNASGGIEAEYEYDAWGYIRSVEDVNGIGAVNPLRYRGYYYDEETGFYYLNSRYYDPEIGRFINADTTDILGIQGDFYDKNLFAYCDNNPVVRKDTTGEFWETVVDIFFFGKGIVDVVNNPDDAGAWLGLAADAACLVLPFVAGGGTVVKASIKCDDVIDSSKTVGTITGYTKHGLEQAMGRNGVGVSPKGILDAVKNPIRIESKIDYLGRKSFKYVGKESVVVANEVGKIITCWAKKSTNWRVKK